MVDTEEDAMDVFVTIVHYFTCKEIIAWVIEHWPEERWQWSVLLSSR